jgi:ribosomal protein S8E
MYGFHKTKQKNNEHWFMHEYFRRDDKTLLLDMKRKSKDTPSEKKEDTEPIPTTTESETMKLIKSLQAKVKDQDKKINQLFEANKEFKNSILTLYMELEKSKTETKMQMPEFVKFFKNAAENFSNTGTKNSVNKVLYLNNEDNHNINNPMNNYNAFLGNNQRFMPTMDIKNGGIYWDNRANFGYFQGKSAPPSKPYMNSEGQHPNNFMIENGGQSPGMHSRQMREEHLGINNKNIQKHFISSPSPVDNETWKKIQAVKQRSRSPSVGINDARMKSFERSHHLFSRENSMILEMDNLAKNPDFDKISLASENSFGNILLRHEEKMAKMQQIIINPDNSAFEQMSSLSKSDAVEIRSVSSFSSDGRFWGKKRRNAF